MARERLWLNDIPEPPKDYKPNKSDKQIMAKFLELRPSARSDADAIWETAADLELSSKRVSQVIKKANLKKEAKVLKEQVAEALFKERIPMMKEITGLTLHKALEFLKSYEPENLFDVRTLTSVFKDIQTMLRLDLGQSTENVAIQHKGHFTIEQTQKLLADLRVHDKIFLEGLLGVGQQSSTAGADAVSSAPSGGAAKALSQDREDPPETAA